MGEAPMFADGRISMYDDRNDGDPEDLRFGSCGETTELTEQYVTTAQYMARDLDDPYAYEKKPIHHIPGYTGHLPLNRERFGVNYREASAATIAMQKAKGVHNPVIALDQTPPNYVRARLRTRTMLSHHAYALTLSHLARLPTGQPLASLACALPSQSVTPCDVGKH